MNSGKEPACDAGNLGSIPRLERSPGGGPGNPLQYPLPGEFHGQRSLADYNPQGLTELDMTEATKQQQTIYHSTMLLFPQSQECTVGMDIFSN